MTVEYSRRKSNMRGRRAQSIIETVVGIIFLIPIVLFLFDVAVLVLASSANDNLAKSACRAAASAVGGTGQGTPAAGLAAAEAVCNNFAVSTIIRRPGASFLTDFSYNGGTLRGTATSQGGQVTVITTMDVRVPVSFPFLSSANFRAQAVEPIVSISP